jgi:hypothetical protein
LIADKQQVLLDELLSMKDVTQEELVGILKDMGQTAEDDETLVGGIRGGFLYMACTSRCGRKEHDATADGVGG